jgi:hypothetical protein
VHHVASYTDYAIPSHMKEIRKQEKEKRKIEGRRKGKEEHENK